MREVVRDELGPVPTLTQMEVDSGRGLSHHLLEEEEKKKLGRERKRDIESLQVKK